jgi:hypothetical protein
VVYHASQEKSGAKADRLKAGGFNLVMENKQ